MGEHAVSSLRPQTRSAAPATREERNRANLVAELRKQGISDERVLASIGRIPRHEFVDIGMQPRAYETNALPIGHAQTISHPYIVALMTQVLLNGKKLGRVLEIGTGSGYQTAVLAEFCDTVYTVERIKALTEVARKRLAAMKYRNIHFGYADGMNGWLPYAPYDGIIVTAGATEVPQPLLEQLAMGGRLVIPAGPANHQSLLLIGRTARGYTKQEIAPVSFVPLLGGRA